MKIVAEIPAREGSKRVKKKNLKLLCGKPLIQYSIDSAKKSKYLTDIYVNTDSIEIGKLAINSGVKYYKRKKCLAKDKIVSDQFNYAFIKSVNPDILVMLNPVSPLIETEDIDNAIDYFLSKNYDSMISVREEYLQTLYKDNPINFDIDKLLCQTQNVSPIQVCVWSICIWKASTFINSFEKNGYAVFSGNVGYYPISKNKSIKISTIEDFEMAEALLYYRNRKNEI